MNAQRLSSIAVTLVLSLSGLVQAQGPWPTLNTPSFFSPVNEFFSPRPYSTQYQPYAPSYNGTQIIPGVPQCANGRCQTSCPNGQCTTGNNCANGRCSVPTSSYYGSTTSNYAPSLGRGGCVNGQCGPGNSYSTNYTPNCANGQCRPSNGGFNSSLFQPGYSSQIGLRPLTPNYQVPASYRGAVNRLTPVDGFSAPAAPIYRNRESQIPSGPDYTYDPSIKLR
jgi:hypothetical protein